MDDGVGVGANEVASNSEESRVPEDGQQTAHEGNAEHELFGGEERGEGERPLEGEKSRSRPDTINEPQKQR